MQHCITLRLACPRAPNDITLIGDSGLSIIHFTFSDNFVHSTN